MAWTAPRTWTDGETVTAVLLNTHVRDNLKAIGDAWTAYTPALTGVTLGNGTGGPPVHLDDGRAVFFVSPGPRLWFTDGTPEGSASVPVNSA